MTRAALLLPAFALLVACGDKDDDTATDDTGHEGHGEDDTASSGGGDDGGGDGGGGDDSLDVAFTITPELAGVVPACGETLTGVGSTATTAELADFRFFVHDLRFVTADGTEVAVTLDDDGAWQNGTVALLDYEDATGRCANGTSATNDTVHGTVAAGEYVAARFVLGVPFDLNHADPAAATSPLNLTALHWNWQGGYKFLRLDVITEGQPEGWFVHLGSTGCDADEAGEITSCARPNRVDVEVSSTTGAVLDLDALYAGSDVDTNAGDAKGCMSGVDDPECGAIFDALGLSETVTTQSVFTAE